MMSLTKIPFILLATWGFKITSTSPNPPPPKHERIKSRVPMENATYILWAPYTARLIQFAFAIAEIATILVSAIPSWSLSKPILSLLVWTGGKPENLRMSTATAFGVVLMVFGAWIRVMTYRHLGRFFRFEASIQKDHELIVSGPYAVVRHPSYTGMMLVYIGWFPWQLSKGSWVVESGLWNTTLGRTFVMAYIIIFIFGTAYLVLERMSKEDVALKNKFESKWDDWAKRVPYSVLPGIY